jgi:hypothetical protein
MRALALIVAMGCTSTPPLSAADLGRACGSGCPSGFTCLAIHQTSEADGSCYVDAEVCSIACDSDDDCTSAFGSGVHCLRECMSSGQCSLE